MQERRHRKLFPSQLQIMAITSLWIALQRVFLPITQDRPLLQFKHSKSAIVRRIVKVQTDLDIRSMERTPLWHRQPSQGQSLAKEAPITRQ